MSLDDHRRGFAIAMIGLISEFNVYLDRGGANPTADSVSYRQGTIWASPEDLNQVRRQMLAAMRPLLANTPGIIPAQIAVGDYWWIVRTTRHDSPHGWWLFVVVAGILADCVRTGGRGLTAERCSYSIAIACSAQYPWKRDTCTKSRAGLRPCARRNIGVTIWLRGRRTS